MAKTLKNYWYRDLDTAGAKAVGSNDWVQQVQVVGRFPSKAAFARAVVAVPNKTYYSVASVSGTVNEGGALPGELQAETLYFHPIHPVDGSPFVRVDVTHPPKES